MPALNTAAPLQLPPDLADHLLDKLVPAALFAARTSLPQGQCSALRLRSGCAAHNQMLSAACVEAQRLGLPVPHECEWQAAILLHVS
jgi:hypothetical protein